MNVDVIIVGGGASGLFAGIIAGRRGKKVLILEQKEKIGKKILATGNGKCNYTNQHYNDRCYRGGNPAFAEKVLNRFSHMQLIEEFQKMGIEPKNRNGYYYPASEQAASVLEVLRQELVHNGVRIHTGERVERVYAGKKGFVVETNQSMPSLDQLGKHVATSVILSTGGCAYPTLGSDGSGYELAHMLGHRIITPLPALTSLKVKEKFIKMLAGVRVEARLRMMVDGQSVAKELGELQLVKYGISGIPVFQISRFASKALMEGKRVTCHLDFFPYVSGEELSGMLESRVREIGYKSMEEFLVGLLHNKLVYVLVKESGISLSRTASEVSVGEWGRMVEVMKGLRVTVTESSGFDQAQVTAGGICTDDVNPDTMESNIRKNLYLTGELLDIDGICGGYNLQWAWSTGYLAGSKA